MFWRAEPSGSAHANRRSAQRRIVETFDDAISIDSRGGGGFSPEQRNRVLSHMKARSHLTSRLLVQAVVIDNLIQRTLYYGVRLLLPSPFPSKVFAHPGAAETWLMQEIGSSTEWVPPDDITGERSEPPGEG